MFRIEGLRKSFGSDASRPLFENVSLELVPGRCVAVMGESGAGKSTLLNCIAGLEPVDGGRILLEDRDITGLDDDAFAALRRRAFGFVFQAFHILPHLTVLQNVALPLWLLGRQDAEAARAASGMLERVGLLALADVLPSRLSGGELQRVAIARALVHRPVVVLADEPTGNLDPDRASDVLDLLLECVRGAGAAGILVTHSHAAAARADAILRLTRHGLLPPGEGA